MSASRLVPVFDSRSLDVLPCVCLCEWCFGRWSTTRTASLREGMRRCFRLAERKDLSTSVPHRGLLPPMRHTLEHTPPRAPAPTPFRSQTCSYCVLSRKALAEAAERARELQMFVAMAPEGTRTKTGQLGPFKKVQQGCAGNEQPTELCVARYILRSSTRAFVATPCKP